MNKNFDTMERVLKLWEVELTSVLDITAVGHRKRILASLENRKKLERQFPSLVRTLLKRDNSCMLIKQFPVCTRLKAPILSTMIPLPEN